MRLKLPTTLFRAGIHIDCALLALALSARSIACTARRMQSGVPVRQEEISACSSNRYMTGSNLFGCVLSLAVLNKRVQLMKFIVIISDTQLENMHNMRPHAHYLRNYPHYNAVHQQRLWEAGGPIMYGNIHIAVVAPQIGTLFRTQQVPSNTNLFGIITLLIYLDAIVWRWPRPACTAERQVTFAITQTSSPSLEIICMSFSCTT